ncbi:endonuclease domain-containing protein [Streptomyces zhihengii]|uniref:endonuclease domain-containing protein n=1 Tax=Streptomyces zhihengii TaxID=1818004 RepID=UPI001FD1BC05|nr:endonuclease domain-containing protein [Streptomyces zhihengii]
MRELAVTGRADGPISLEAADALWAGLTAGGDVPTVSGACTRPPARARTGYVLLGSRVVTTVAVDGGLWGAPEREVRLAAAELNAVGMDRRDLVRVGPFREAPEPERDGGTALRWRRRVAEELREPGGPRDGADRTGHLAGVDWRQVLVERVRDGSRTWWLPRTVVRLLDAAEHAEARWLRAARPGGPGAAVAGPPAAARRWASARSSAPPTAPAPGVAEDRRVAPGVAEDRRVSARSSGPPTAPAPGVAENRRAAPGVAENRRVSARSSAPPTAPAPGVAEDRRAAGPEGPDAAPRPYGREFEGRLYSVLSRKPGISRKVGEWLCAVCREAPATVLDHCHEHGYVRAPVCQSCNTRERPDHLYADDVRVANRYTRLFGTGAGDWLRHWHRCTGCRARTVLPLPHLAAWTAFIACRSLRPTHRASRGREPCGDLRVSWTGSQKTPRTCLFTVSVDFCPAGEHRVLARVPYREAADRFRGWLAETAPAVAAAAGPDRVDDLPERPRPVVADPGGEGMGLF